MKSALYEAGGSEELLLSIIGEARFSFGFPDLECVPAAPRELELVWGMHSTHEFIGIRRYVYRTPVSPDQRTTVRSGAASNASTRVTASAGDSPA